DRARRIAHQTREVHDGGRPVHGLDELDDVRRVALDELEARVLEEIPNRLLAEHERVEDAHPPALSEELLDDVRADVAGAADHEDRTHPVAHEGRPDGLHQPALPARPTVRAEARSVIPGRKASSSGYVSANMST